MTKKEFQDFLNKESYNYKIKDNFQYTNFRWSYSIDYYLCGYNALFKDEVCFARAVDDDKCFKTTAVVLLNFENKRTMHLTKKYVQYIFDALKIEGGVVDTNYVYVPTQGCYLSTLLPLTLIRILFESLGNNTYENRDHTLTFLNLLFEGKCRYKNKLKRFCYFYKKAYDISIEKYKKLKYWSTGHSFVPNYTQILSTNDYLKALDKDHGINSVNRFFYGEL